MVPKRGVEMRKKANRNGGARLPQRERAELETGTPTRVEKVKNNVQGQPKRPHWGEAPEVGAVKDYKSVSGKR